MRRHILAIIMVAWAFNYLPADNYGIVRNPAYLDYRYEFAKLAEDEVLSYRYEPANGMSFFTADKERSRTKSMTGNILKLYAKNTKTNQERPIGAWDTLYFEYQFSTDKRTGIIFWATRSAAHPLLKIDGNAGAITYLMDINASARSTRNVDYILCNVYGEVVNNMVTKIQFALIDLRELTVVKLIDWGITPQLGAGSYILRSADADYDFKIAYDGEEGLYAIAYYDIKTDKFVTTFDVTGFGDSAWKHVGELEKPTHVELGLPD